MVGKEVVKPKRKKVILKLQEGNTAITNNANKWKVSHHI